MTTSRRTSSKIEALINEYNFNYKIIYSKEPNINPIGDFIAICDKFFITIDSTSMLSEVRANSDAKINIIELESKKENTKYHKLASIINDMDEKLDFVKILKRIKDQNPSYLTESLDLLASCYEHLDQKEEDERQRKHKKEERKRDCRKTVHSNDSRL